MRYRIGRFKTITMIRNQGKRNEPRKSELFPESPIDATKRKMMKKDKSGLKRNLIVLLKILLLKSRPVLFDMAERSRLPRKQHEGDGFGPVGDGLIELALLVEEAAQVVEDVPELGV